MITIEEAKTYLRIDGDAEDDLLKLLIANARHYILDSVDNLDLENDKVKDKSKLLAMVLLSDWYENRSYMYEKRESPNVRWTVRSILMQIQAECLGDPNEA